MKKLFYLLILLILAFVSCSNHNNTNEGNKTAYKLEGMVLELHENSILINAEDGLYSVGLNDLDVSDVELGDTIIFGFDGTVMESYPMQISAEEIVELKKGELLVELSGKVTGFNETSIEVEDYDGNPYIVHFDNFIKFNQGISEELVLGNLVTITYGGEVMESYPMQINGIMVIANEMDQMISLDPREKVSGFVGEFPSVIIDREEMTNVTLNEAFAIALPITGSYHWELDMTDLSLDVLNDGIDDNLSSDNAIHYFGFKASKEGIYKLTFYEKEKEETIKTVEFVIEVK